MTPTATIPSHWKSGNIRRFAQMKSGHTPSRSVPAYWENTDIPWFTLADVWQLRDGKQIYLGDTANKINELGLANSAAELLPAGTVVLSRTASVGFSGIMPRPMATSQDFWNWVCGPELLPEYLNYQFKSMTAEFKSLNMGSTHQTIYQKDAATLQIVVPPLEEQRAIADYLDRETARIETLIEEQQRLIEMLRGRRKAVVEQAVFSGLEGAPMKSNAEPWLPPTPCHWRVVQLGFVSDTAAGYAFPSDGFSSDEGHVRLLRGVNVKPGRINWTDTVYWDVETAAVPSEFVLEVGDLVFGMDRPFVGGGVRVASISDNDLPALLLQRVMRIRPNDEAGRGYMRYVMSTDVFFNYLEPLFTGVSVPHVSEWQVRKFKMPFPPLDEQKSIAAYLDKQTTKIDILIAEAERFIELARERWAALITAAVTGQIDVREMV
ncbi:restriction endonuclease subunit S [Planosporangium sp. 12N6]|uniref:restriction endonuclease subunit S n=1 Tax=Planosporangium spinosum TaxID=3402278 RepID=UPI003CF800CD